jgi:hypothetical protein
LPLDEGSTAAGFADRVTRRAVTATSGFVAQRGGPLNLSFLRDIHDEAKFRVPRRASEFLDILFCLMHAG